MCTSTEKPLDIAVIGGGAAGLSAAFFARAAGARVTVFERNEKLGKKIYITGKGRCNATNLCDREEFLRNVPRNPRFLYAALDFLSPQGLIDLMESLGCPMKVERGRRAFPVSDHASDVTRALEKGLRENGVKIRLNSRVASVIVHGGVARGVAMEGGEELLFDAVILACGGLSYPATGSTGDGLRMAEQTGHKTEATHPSLVPYEVSDAWRGDMQGLSLKNVCLTARYCGKIIYCENGEMLFTHFGVSGPLILELSSHIAGLPLPDVQATIDLKAALSREQLAERLSREIEGARKAHLSRVSASLLPASMVPVFPRVSGVSGDTPCSHVTSAQREKIVDALKAFPLHLSASRSYLEAVVTRGGVSVKEINPSTMQSKRVRNLYFAGEMIDVDAHTGGYNLQIAFATGALAGDSAAHQSIS